MGVAQKFCCVGGSHLLHRGVGRFQLSTSRPLFALSLLYCMIWQIASSFFLGPAHAGPLSVSAAAGSLIMPVGGAVIQPEEHTGTCVPFIRLHGRQIAAARAQYCFGRAKLPLSDFSYCTARLSASRHSTAAASCAAVTAKASPPPSTVNPSPELALRSARRSR